MLSQNKLIVGALLLSVVACGPAKQAGGFCDPFTQNEDVCNGKSVQITGAHSRYTEQHPILTLDKKESYWEVSNQGQWIFVSDDSIKCAKEVVVTGTLRSRVGPCDARANNKNQYCGTAVYVKTWQCK